MTKQEYINQLRSAMAGCDPKEIEEAVRYVEEYFDESELTNEEIMNNLGTPEQFAQKTGAKSNYTVPPVPPVVPKKSKKWIGFVAVGAVLVVALIFVVGSMLFPFDLIEDRIEYEIQYNPNKNGNGNNVGKHLNNSVDLSSISSIDITGTQLDIEIIGSTSNRLVIPNAYQDSVTYSESDGQLSIVSSYTGYHDDPEMILYVSDTNLSLSTVLDVGEVKIENVTLSSADLSIGTGDLDLERVNCPKINANVSTGSVEMKLLGREDEYAYNLICNLGEVSYGNWEREGQIAESKGVASSEKSLNITVDTGEIDVEFK